MITFGLENSLLLKLKDVKFLRVPISGFEDYVIHTQPDYCKVLEAEFTSDEEYTFYMQLLNDAEDYGDAGYLERISINELVENEKNYCPFCRDETLISFEEDDMFSMRLSEFIAKVTYVENSLNGKNNVSYDEDTIFYFLLEFNKVFNTCEIFQKYKKETFSKMTLKKFANEKVLSSVRESVVSKLLKHVEDPNVLGCGFETFVKECNFEIETVPEVNFTALENVLFNDTRVVLFSFNFKFFDVLLSKNPKNENVLKNIYLHPSFVEDKINMLPYVEFILLKKLVESSNLLKRTRESLASENKVLVLNEVPSKEIFTTMISLYDESSPALSSYETLFNVSTNV